MIAVIIVLFILDRFLGIYWYWFDPEHSVIPFFIAAFFFVLIEIASLYRTERKYCSEVLANKPMTTQYPSSKPGRTSSLGGIAIFLGLVFLLYLLTFLFPDHLPWDFIIAYIFVLTLFLIGLGYVAARGIMNKHKEKYLTAFKQRDKLFFALFPIPWILFGAIFFGLGSVLGFFEEVLGSPYQGVFVLGASSMYGFLSIAGLVAIASRKWWPGYTLSQLSASLTFLVAVMLPFSIDLAVSSLGPIIASIVLSFLIIQGALDESGDMLREARRTMKESPRWAKWYSRGDPRHEEYYATYYKRLAASQFLSAYRSVSVNLTLILGSIFGITLIVGPFFVALGTGVGGELLEQVLMLDYLSEMLGVVFGIIVSTIAIAFRKRKKEQYQIPHR